MKICSVLLTVWYFMSIIGFDVHTCKGDERSFVATFLSGVTCEDIHPEHHCCDSHHEESADGPGFTASSCCSDDFQVLYLTGISGNDGSRYDEDFHSVYPVSVPDRNAAIGGSGFLSEYLGMLAWPDSGLVASGDILTFLGIWRI